MRVRTMLLTAGAAMLLATLLPLHGTAQQKEDAGKVTVTGEIVDSACFVTKGLRGDGHKQCATSCAKAGVALSVYDADADKLYIVIGRGANEKLLPFVAQNAKVTGTLAKRAGQEVLVLESVEPAG